MRQFVMAGLFVIMAVVIMSCGSKVQQKVQTEESNLVEIYEPAWWDSCQVSDESLCDKATMDSKEQQFAMTKASATAQSRLQQQLESKLEVFYNGFGEEIGLAEDADFRAMYVQTIKQVASGVLQGSVPWRDETRIDKETSVYRAWVAYKLLLNNAYLEQLRAIRSNNNLYTQFRRSEAFKDHEKEIEKFEQYKKEQGL